MITSEKNRASSKEQVLGAATKLATAVRKALGDDTSDADTAVRDGHAVGDVSGRGARIRGGGAGDVQQPHSRTRSSILRTPIARDPTFGLAYAGMAIVSENVGHQQDAEKYIKEAIRPSRRHDRARALPDARPLLLITSDYQQCVKEYGDLIARYAADAVGAQQPRAVPHLPPQHAEGASKRCGRWSRFCPSARSTARIWRSLPTTTAISRSGTRGASDPGAGHVRPAGPGLRAARPRTGG